MPKFVALFATALLLPMVSTAHAQDQTSAIQLQLKSQIAVTNISKDGVISKAGAIVELHKDGLMTYSLLSPLPPVNYYKNGKITQGMGGFGRDLAMGMLSTNGSTANDYPHKKWASGEKFWVAEIKVAKDGISLLLVSDPYDDVRYWGQLKFPFAKGAMPSPDDAIKEVSEVFTILPPDNAAANAQPAAPAMAPIAPPPPPPDAAPPPIAPPPPPDAAVPKAVTLGQTKDQVIAIKGKPQQVLHTSSGKTIYKYQDMDITFTKGVVTDAQ
jgi:hypothetical protein